MLLAFIRFGLLQKPWLRELREVSSSFGAGASASAGVPVPVQCHCGPSSPGRSNITPSFRGVGFIGEGGFVVIAK